MCRCAGRVYFGRKFDNDKARRDGRDEQCVAPCVVSVGCALCCAGEALCLKSLALDRVSAWSSHCQWLLALRMGIA